MKVKCIKAYYDLQLKKSVNVGEVYDVTDERAEELGSANNKAGVVLVEVLPDTEPQAAEKPAKGRKKKQEE